MMMMMNRSARSVRIIKWKFNERKGAKEEAISWPLIGRTGRRLLMCISFGSGCGGGVGVGVGFSGRSLASSKMLLKWSAALGLFEGDVSVAGSSSSICGIGFRARDGFS